MRNEKQESHIPDTYGSVVLTVVIRYSFDFEWSKETGRWRRSADGNETNSRLGYRVATCKRSIQNYPLKKNLKKSDNASVLPRLVLKRRGRSVRLEPVSSLP